jgi:hypothetical protein
MSGLACSAWSSWDNITGLAGAPATPDGLSDHKAVGIYFAQRAGIESYSLYSEELGGAAAPDLPYGLAGPAARDLITLAVITAGEHERRPDTGPAAFLRALREVGQGWRDDRGFHRLALGVLPAVRAGSG